MKANSISFKAGITLVLITAFVSGISIFANSYAVKGFDSSVFTFAKNVVVAVLLFAVLLAFGHWRQLRALSRKQWLQLAGIGLIGGSIPFLLFFKGLQLTSGNTASFIHKTLFLYAAVLAVIFLREKLTWGILAGTALLLIGNYFFIRPDFSLVAAHLLVFAAAVMWAAENVWAKHLLKKLDGTTVAFGRMFFGSMFILVFLLFTGKASLIAAMSGAQYVWIALTSALLFVYVLTFYNGLRAVPVSTATALLALGSPVTTALSWIFRDVAVTAYDIAGMVLVVVGIASILWFSRMEHDVQVTVADEKRH